MPSLFDMVSGRLYPSAMGRTSARGRRNRVRQARLIAELTQAQLADAVGVTRQTIVAVEAGDYAPSVYLALAIAGHVDSTVEQLFGPGPTATVHGQRREAGGEDAARLEQQPGRR